MKVADFFSLPPMLQQALVAENWAKRMSSVTLGIHSIQPVFR
jgi:hypothetical protein